MQKQVFSSHSLEPILKSSAVLKRTTNLYTPHHVCTPLNNFGAPWDIPYDRLTNIALDALSMRLQL